MAGMKHNWQIVGIQFGFMYSLNAHLFRGANERDLTVFLGFMLSWGLGFSLKENLLREIGERIISAESRDPSILSLCSSMEEQNPLLLSDILGLRFKISYPTQYAVLKLL